MTFAQFTSLVNACPDGVVLLEGRRVIPAAEADRATAIAAHLARTFPQLRFRSGNATGSDHAFSQGIIEVDATRLQVVAPYATHRSKSRVAGVTYASVDDLTGAEEEEMAWKTSQASPSNRSLVEKRHKIPRLAPKAACLIRDTMKVTGSAGNFPKPLCGLFYIDPADPLAGGTGHTIRVCRQESVPVVFQDSWGKWM